MDNANREATGRKHKATRPRTEGRGDDLKSESDADAEPVTTLVLDLFRFKDHVRGKFHTANRANRTERGAGWARGWKLPQASAA